MTINTAKRRMLEGKPAIGAEVGLGSPLVAEVMSPLGFDFIIVDTQHGAWTDDSAMYAFRSISLGPATPMARVRQNDFGDIGRLLDAGALGVVVPMINSGEDAEAAAFAARFPPRGGRSGGEFGARYHGEDYIDRIDDEVFLAVQIETKRGLENAEEIMSVPGVDGCWVGPNDLGKSLGLDLNTAKDKEAHTAAIQEIVDACKKNNKVPGVSMGSAAAAKPWIERGCLFVTAGGDDGWVIDGATETLRQLGRSN